MLPCFIKSVRSISQLSKVGSFQPPSFPNSSGKSFTKESSVKFNVFFSLASQYSIRSSLIAVKFSTMISSISMEVSKHQAISSPDINIACSANVCATPDIEKKYVHHVYDVIAPHFSATRFAKWPKVATFLNSLSAGSVILDVGCGNGKYLGFTTNCSYIGCDISPPLVDICSRKGHEVLVADAVKLPYKTNFGDAAISIAVLHHLSTESRRRKAIEELIRVVRRGGHVLVTVWAVEQEDCSLLSKWTPLSEKYNEGWVSLGNSPTRNSAALILEDIPEVNEDCSASNLLKEECTHPVDGEPNQEYFVGIQEDNIASGYGRVETNQEYFVPWHLPYHCAEVSGTSSFAIANGLAKKEDKKRAVVYNRYYHVFVEGELQRRWIRFAWDAWHSLRLVAGIGDASIVEQFYDKSNWCIILQKI